MNEYMRMADRMYDLSNQFEQLKKKNEDLSKDYKGDGKMKDEEMAEQFANNGYALGCTKTPFESAKELKPIIEPFTVALGIDTHE